MLLYSESCFGAAPRRGEGRGWALLLELPAGNNPREASHVWSGGGCSIPPNHTTGILQGPSDLRVWVQGIGIPFLLICEEWGAVGGCFQQRKSAGSSDTGPCCSSRDLVSSLLK